MRERSFWFRWVAVLHSYKIHGFICGYSPHHQSFRTPVWFGWQPDVSGKDPFDVDEVHPTLNAKVGSPDKYRYESNGRHHPPDEQFSSVPKCKDKDDSKRRDLKKYIHTKYVECGRQD